MKWTPKTLHQRTCEECGRAWRSIHREARYCRPACSQRARRKRVKAELERLRAVERAYEDINL